MQYNKGVNIQLPVSNLNRFELPVYPTPRFATPRFGMIETGSSNLLDLFLVHTLFRM